MSIGARLNSIAAVSILNGKINIAITEQLSELSPFDKAFMDSFYVLQFRLRAIKRKDKPLDR